MNLSNAYDLSASETARERFRYEQVTLRFVLSFLTGFPSQRQIPWDDVIGKKLRRKAETFNCIEFLEKPLCRNGRGIVTVCGGDYKNGHGFYDLRSLSKIAQPAAYFPATAINSCQRSSAQLEL